MIMMDKKRKGRLYVAIGRLQEVQAEGALLPEAVDAEMIAQVISRWTGIPASRLAHLKLAAQAAGKELDWDALVPSTPESRAA